MFLWTLLLLLLVLALSVSQTPLVVECDNLREFFFPLTFLVVVSLATLDTLAALIAFVISSQKLNVTGTPATEL